MDVYIEMGVIKQLGGVSVNKQTVKFGGEVYASAAIKQGKSMKSVGYEGKNSGVDRGGA